MMPKNLLAYVSQVGILLAAVLGFVMTVLHHGDTNSYLAAVLPVIGGLGILARVEARSDKQDAALTQITAQTNGVLDGRIRDGVRAVLADLRLVSTELHNHVDAPAPDPVAPVYVTPPAVTDSLAGADSASTTAVVNTPAPVAPPLPYGLVDAVAAALAQRGGQGA